MFSHEFNCFVMMSHGLRIACVLLLEFVLIHMYILNKFGATCKLAFDNALIAAHAPNANKELCTRQYKPKAYV